MTHRDEPANEPGNGESPEPSAETEAEVEAAPEEIVEIVPPKTEAEELRDQLRATEGRLRAVSKAYTDLEAEMDAFRRRMTLNAEQRVERKAAELAEAFFEPVQNLRRSLAAGKDDPAAVIDGLHMISQQFTDVLHRLGLQEVPGVGAAFDPAVHEAIAVAPTTDPAQDGKVIMVHATGYKIGNKVLQPAQVVIGKLGNAPEA